jgi:hypothetical protein
MKTAVEKKFWSVPGMGRLGFNVIQGSRRVRHFVIIVRRNFGLFWLDICARWCGDAWLSSFIGYLFVKTVRQLHTRLFKTCKPSTGMKANQGLSDQNQALHPLVVSPPGHESRFSGQMNL